MSRLERIGWTFGFAVMASLLMVPAAGAYIDGGSTTVIFQALIAGAAVAGLTLRTFWGRLVGFFRRGRSKTTAGPTE